jgi:hypothetical protein
MSSNVAAGGNLLLGHGEVYFDRLSAAGAKTGERFLGNVSSLSIAMNNETKEKYDSVTAAGNLLARVITRTTAELSLTLTEFTAKNLALFALGDDSSPITQTGAAVVAESLNGGIAIPSTDAWYPLAFRGSVASPLTAVTVKVAASTKTLGTDYLLDLVGGRVYIIAGGTIVAGTSVVTVDYTYPTLTAGSTALDRVLAGTRADVTGLLRFIGVPAAGPKWEAIVWKVSFTPDGELALIADDFGEFKLKGAILADGVHTDLYQLIKRG